MKRTQAVTPYVEVLNKRELQAAPREEAGEGAMGKNVLMTSDGRPVCDIIVYNDTAPACEQRMDNSKLLVMTEMIHRELKMQDPSYDPHGGFGKDKALQDELRQKEAEIWAQPFVPKPLTSSMLPAQLEESKLLHYRVNTGFCDLPMAATTANAFAYRPAPDRTVEFNRRKTGFVAFADEAIKLHIDRHKTGH